MGYYHIQFAKSQKRKEKETLKRFRRNQSGVLYVYLVLILALAVAIFFGFMFMNLVGKMQDAINPLLASDQWASTAHYDAFYYAALFVTNIWTYIIGFAIFVAIYWSYHYTQRRGAGY